MTKQKANKLSVYLIREGFTEQTAMLRDTLKRKSIEVDSVGTFYYETSSANPPSWIQKFFGTKLDGASLFTAIAKGLLLTKVDIGQGKERTFAVAFGHGWLLLEPGAIEERFGLRVVINSVKPDSLRRIDKKNLSSTPRDTHEQISQASGIGAFGIDIEQDLIRGITGVSKLEKLGKTISGANNLSVSVPIDHLNLHDFLKLCYQQYDSAEYKQEFGWIDQIGEVRDKAAIDKLDARLIAMLKSDDPGHVWMAVPDLIDWADVKGFKFRETRKADSFEDIYLEDFLSSLSDEERKGLSIDTLKSKSVYRYSSSTDFALHHWKAYNCLYCEMQGVVKGKTHLLSNGKWFEVEQSFAKRVNDDYVVLRDAAPSCNLPPYSHKDEGEYNTKAAENDTNYYCLDKKLIPFGGGYGKVEVCDLYSKERKFIHVKRYGSSAVLSHLFSQGVVPGELFKMEPEFRKKLNDKLPATHKLGDTNVQPNISDFEVVYAIISTKNVPLEIPFFSKVTLRNAKRRLIGYGYQVSLTKIGTSQTANNTATRSE